MIQMTRETKSGWCVLSVRGRADAEASDALELLGAKVTGIAVLIDRSEQFEPWAPFFASYRVNSSSYPADEIPGWLAAIPATKPGTRVAK